MTFENFLLNYEKVIIPLSKKTSNAYFDASISGKEQDYKKAADLQLELSKFLSDKELFGQLQNIKNSAKPDDKLLLRQFDHIYNSFLSHQFSPDILEKIITISSKVEEKFSTFRAKINNREVTDNEIDEILDKSTDETQLIKCWEASKTIGEEIVEDVLTLVELRNSSAKELGFSDYHEMSLEISEQKRTEIDQLFDELDNLTRDSFIEQKSKMDDHLASRFSIKKNQLMPWHYQDKFFQQGPRIEDVDLDVYFKDQDLVQLTVDYFDGLGLDIRDLLKKSDLFEKEGKYQHAFCTDIDREGDVRVVCNIKPNQRWMSTMLHEFGHAVYDKYVDRALPWELREHCHIFTTEAIAMLFGRMANSPYWLESVGLVNQAEKARLATICFNSLKSEQLVFSRWVQVVYRFEREMYADPKQNLNRLWWDLVNEYQMLAIPENRNKPDWASKIHIALYPAYYHNYMLGELLASQLYQYIMINIQGKSGTLNPSLYGEKAAGDYLIHRFFKYGSSVSWRELIELATDESLSPKYFANQFV